MLRLAPSLCRATRTALPLKTSNATCAFASKASPAWLQEDKLKEKLKAIQDEHNTREQRLDHAEKILPYYTLFPNEADPTKPSKEAVEAVVSAALPVDIARESAIPVPKWREALAKFEKDNAERQAAERQAAEQKKKQGDAAKASHHH